MTWTLISEIYFTCQRLVDFELLTAIESQTLRASEIQLRYKNPGFSRFSSYRQSLKMTSYCQLDLTNGKNASKVKVKKS